MLILILLNHKKEQNNAICSRVDGSRHCHRHRKTDAGIAYVWNLKKKVQMNLLQNSKVTDTENKLMVSREYVRRGVNWEIGIYICKVVYTKIDN